MTAVQSVLVVRKFRLSGSHLVSSQVDRHIILGIDDEPGGWTCHPQTISQMLQEQGDSKARWLLSQL